MKIGLLGLGQAGGKMVETIMKLTQENDQVEFIPFVVNLAKHDLDGLDLPLVNKLHILNPMGANGAGRNTQVPYDSLTNPQNQEKFFNKIEELFGLNLDGNSEYQFKVQQLFVFLGSGGGTGNGFLQAILSTAFVTAMPHVSIVMATPRQIDSIEEKRNTANLMRWLGQTTLDREIGSIFVINNDQFTKIKGEWMKEANQIFATRFINSFLRSAQNSIKSVDDADLLNVFREQGYASIFMFTGQPDSALSAKLAKLNDYGIAIRSASTYVLMASGDQNVTQYESSILSTIRSYSPESERLYIGFYPQEISIEDESICLISGMSEPQFLIDLVDEVNKSSDKPDITSKIRVSAPTEQNPTSTRKEPERRKFPGFAKR